VLFKKKPDVSRYLNAYGTCPDASRQFARLGTYTYIYEMTRNVWDAITIVGIHTATHYRLSTTFLEVVSLVRVFLQILVNHERSYLAFTYT